MIAVGSGHPLDGKIYWELSALPLAGGIATYAVGCSHAHRADMQLTPSLLPGGAGALVTRRW